MSVVVTIVSMLAIIVGLAYVCVHSGLFQRKGSTVIDASRNSQPQRVRQ